MCRVKATVSLLEVVSILNGRKPLFLPMALYQNFPFLDTKMVWEPPRQRLNAPENSVWEV